jgi:hypothetical protein
VGIGTVEKYSKIKLKERNHKEQHITQSLLLGGNWVGLLKNTHKIKTQERNHKEQHITQSLLF